MRNREFGSEATQQTRKQWSSGSLGDGVIRARGSWTDNHLCSCRPRADGGHRGRRGFEVTYVFMVVVRF